MRIDCAKKTIRLGDEIPIVFTITNTGGATYVYDVRTGDRSGRMPEYELAAKGKDGTAVRDPREGHNWGMIGGGLSGIMALAVFTRRANGPGAVCGAIAATLMLYGLQRFTNAHHFFYAFAAFTTAVAVGYVTSLPWKSLLRRES